VLAPPPPVAVDVTPLVGLRTGIGTAVAALVEALDRLADGPPLVPYALSRRARRHRDELPGATRFVPIPARFLLSAWARSEHPRVDRWLRPAAVVHATNYLAPPSRHPTLVSVWDCSFLRRPELASSAVRALGPVLRRAVARGAHLHTGSAYAAGEIDDVLGPGLLAAGRVHVVAPGVPDPGPVGDPSPAVAPLVAAGPYLLALGTLEPRKNLPALVRAFGALAPAHPDLHVVLAGPDGPDRPGIDAAVAGLAPALRDRVAVTGPVGASDKRALLEGATALVYPSRDEGFGFPVLEAMQAGTPVVASRVGAIPEVAGEAAVLVDPEQLDTPEALAGAIATVVDDPDRAAALVAAGRERTGRFSWHRAALGLTDVYRELAR
jgi:glycosyltransferase involved in cell wall biosynthesis